MAGESAGEEAAKAAERARRLQSQADRAAMKARNYAEGQEGEEALSAVLAGLRDDGFLQLDDRELPGRDSNIDHVVVGPCGVCVVDAKKWTGELTVEGLVLRQNNRRRAHEMESLRVQAASIAEILDASRPDDAAVPVRPVMCFVGEARLGGRHVIDRVHLVDVNEVVATIAGFDPALDASGVRAVHQLLGEILRPRAASMRTNDALPPAAPPPEPVLFVTRWQKRGQSRLYVMDEEGTDGGYLDLTKGDIVGATPATTGVLRQLLPHYLSDASADDPANLSDEAKGAVRRFLDRLIGQRAEPSIEHSLVIGYCWKNYGKARLYLHHLKPGGYKADLGWYDLNEARVHETSLGAAEAVRYCGERYLELTRRT